MLGCCQDVFNRGDYEIGALPDQFVPSDRQLAGEPGRRGRRAVTVADKATELGGTSGENTYPVSPATSVLGQRDAQLFQRVRRTQNV
ncbi:hypothetical protein [Mycolicibacterium phocaicum]|uniref:Uncharacterized protein n=1 Tax=Mycolicibacterium phocaicum TaxID=319706 RepID=A0A7I7ZJT3_9MYCO|nr:hypothetical protein [Mycolicibacterium phocaicum]TLH67122.1 hypothetical protein C1S79_14795 [Mycolicibacterium phocaicum]BBZ53434.1 hypothetical protein MPHO_04260 [Mycolicibacterium phocaicum]